MKLAEILLAGSGVVDLVFQGKEFDQRKKGNRLSLAFGGKYTPDNFYQLFGGGATNAAISLARQGFKTALWSRIGKDVFGQQLINHLQKEKVDTQLVKPEASQTQISSILLTSSGERTIINYRADADLIKLTKDVEKELQKKDWLALFSLAKCPKKDKLEILQAAQENNCQIFLSLHGTEYARGLSHLRDYFPYCNILHLNAHELADIFGGDADDFDFKRINFAQKLKIPLLLVTYDVHGSFAYTRNEIIYQPIVKAKKIVDTTGAGDAFAAGFLGEYLKTNSLKKGLSFAAKNAAAVIEKIGAQVGLLYNQ